MGMDGSPVTDDTLGEEARTGRGGRSGPAGRIVIVRHGRPALDRNAGPRLDWRGYRAWWANYEVGSLAPGQAPPERLLRAAGGAAAIFASERPRAIETARAIAAGREVTADPLFNEAALPPPRWPAPVRCLPKTWNKIARVAWLLGHSDGDEGRRDAERRAARAAERLEREASGGGDVVLAAHGWFNRMIRPELIRRGWRCVRDGGDAYWSFRVYERARRG